MWRYLLEEWIAQILMLERSIDIVTAQISQLNAIREFTADKHRHFANMLEPCVLARSLIKQVRMFHRQ